MDLYKKVRCLDLYFQRLLASKRFQNFCDEYFFARADPIRINWTNKQNFYASEISRI